MSKIEHTLKVGDEVWVRGKYADHFSAKSTKIAKVYKNGRVVLEDYPTLQWRVDGNERFYVGGKEERTDGWSLTETSDKWRAMDATSCRRRFEADQKRKADKEESAKHKSLINSILNQLVESMRYEQPVEALRKLAEDLENVAGDFDLNRKA